MAQTLADHIAKASQRVAEQRRWIEDHGGSRAGYIARYGDSNAPLEERQGDGGQRIHEADEAELRKLEAELAALQAKRR